jgi:hypothetical protein
MCGSLVILNRRLAVGKVLRCRDVGMNCSKEIRAATEEELLKLAREHAEKTMASPPPIFLLQS